MMHHWISTRVLSFDEWEKNWKEFGRDQYTLTLLAGINEHLENIQQVY